MRIGLIDVDGHNFPNLPLMKLSAWHKQQGDDVEFADSEKYYDRVYMSKVFTESKEPEIPKYGELYKSGTGYYYPYGGPELPEKVEHIYPDYELYGVTDVAYGYLTRGCPRKCKFCGVQYKEGTTSRKVANLSEFWRGQKFIKLLDPNITACRDWEELFRQLIESQALIDFTQGLDMRLMTEQKANMLKQMRIKQIHFAWDGYQDKTVILPKFKEFQAITGWDKRQMGVFVLTNFDTTHEQDLERIYLLRELGYRPYVMIYDKQKFVDDKGHWKQGVQERFTVEQMQHFKLCQHVQRWSGNRALFESCPSFHDYERYQNWVRKGKPVPYKAIDEI